MGAEHGTALAKLFTYLLGRREDTSILILILPAPFTLLAD
jgi:hypothetical protein